MSTAKKMSEMIGMKISVTSTAVYCSLNGYSVTVGYQVTGGDIEEAIRVAVSRLRETSK